MRGIKMNKIAIVFILMTVALDTITAQGITVKRPAFHGGSPPTGVMTWLDLQISIPSIPKVGEVFEVTFTVFCKNTLEGSYFGPDYKVFFTSNNATIISGKEQKFSGYLKKDEVKQFKAKMIINKPTSSVSIHGVIATEQRRVWPPQSIGLVIFLVDKETGQYGTREEYERGLSVEYRYDPLVGTFTCSPSQNPAPVEENRAIIKMIRQLAPTLSDSLALVLHSEQYRVGIPKGLPRWDSLNQRWKEEEIFEYYLKDGWLKALQENKLDVWRAKEKQKILDEHKEKKSQFFRGANFGVSGDGDTIRLVSKTFYGHWHYKNHYYNKDQGLLGDAQLDTVKQCRARCLIRYTDYFLPGRK